MDSRQCNASVRASTWSWLAVSGFSAAGTLGLRTARPRLAIRIMKVVARFGAGFLGAGSVASKAEATAPFSPEVSLDRTTAHSSATKVPACAIASS